MLNSGVLLPALIALVTQTSQDINQAVDPARLRTTVEKLASWHNRNTNNQSVIEAAEWVASEYRKIPGVEVELWKYTIPAGRRVPVEKEVVQVVATLKGETDERILVGGHLDTINMLPGQDHNSKAPGANDDATGVALAMECARILAAKKHRHTMQFIAFTGEEQGLIGSSALAKHAKENNWKIIAVLNNDMVGNIENKAGQKEDKLIRLFSEDATEANPNSASRELARFLEWVTRGKVEGHGIKLVYRRDRFGRGGDHTPFHAQGFPAVRFVEVHEEYSRQHTDIDLPEFIDWNYCANNVRLNVIAMQSLANAQDPPTGVRVVNDQAHHTTLRWTAKPGVKYAVYWRDTASATWQGFKEVGEVSTIKIEKVNKDDHHFAVGALGGVPIPAR
jgi:hypothetical protein